MTRYDRLEAFRYRYARLRSGWVPATEIYERRVASVLEPGCRVLDLGCGRGGIVERLGGTGTWIGIDPDWLSLTEHRLPKLPRACAPAWGLPFPAQTFDVVLASWVFEHLPAPDLVFREVARVLRAEGVFFFLTPNVAHPLLRASRGVARLRWLQSWLVSLVYHRAAVDTFPVAYRANSIGDIGKLAAGAGFRLVDIDLIGDPSYFAWNTPTFTIAVALEMGLPPLGKIHLVGQVEKLGVRRRRA